MKKGRFSEEANSHDSPGGRREARAGGREKARDQRPDDLRLAQTLRHAGASGREGAATARAGERSTEENGRGPRARDRRSEEIRQVRPSGQPTPVVRKNYIPDE